MIIRCRPNHDRVITVLSPSHDRLHPAYAVEFAALTWRTADVVRRFRAQGRLGDSGEALHAFADPSLSNENCGRGVISFDKPSWIRVCRLVEAGLVFGTSHYSARDLLTRSLLPELNTNRSAKQQRNKLMKAIQSLFLRRSGRKLGGALIVAALLLSALNAQAALTHRYSFANDVTDSVGGANGTIQGDALVSDGSAYFFGAINADYIELPSGLISNYTAVTFEFWASPADNGNWVELFAFGNQTADGLGANMLMFCPHSGSTPPDFRMSYAQAAPGYTDERVVNGTGVLDNIGPIGVTCVYDPPNNTMSLYTNGTLAGSLSPVTTGAVGFSLTNVHNVHSWLGRSLYNGDAPYNGTIDEFRIYDAALGPLQVYANGIAGPDTIVTDIAVNSLAWNTQSNMVVGTRQTTTVTFNTTAYGSVTLPGATEASYSSDDPATVDVNARGEITAMKLGSATVSAAYNGTTNSVVITVTEPELVHRYTFNSDASDSVGNADGTLVNSATISGGAVTMPGGTTSSDPGSSYVDLPNNLLTNFTAITIEAWVTDNGSEAWARIWDLGNSAGGEDVSDTGSRYLFMALPTNTGNLSGTIHINDRGGDHNMNWPNRRPAVGEEAHIVWSTEASSSTGWLYVNGALVSVNNDTFVTPADMGPTFNNWLGRSQFAADGTFNGSINELRIYNGPISPLQVALNAASGPETTITDPGELQSLAVTIGTNTLSYSGPSVPAALIANFQNVSNVNVTATSEATLQSSDTDVVTVSEIGELTAASTGNVTITGSYGGQTATLQLNVTTPPGYVEPTLAHRYSFSEAAGSTTVQDSVGTANGTIAGTGAVFGQGQLTLPGGTTSDTDPVAGYVDLPNHIINVLTNLSIETWITWEGSGSWQRIFDFGTSASGEDISTGNGAYLFLSPQGPDAMRFSVREPEGGTEPAPITAPTPLPANQEVFVAVTYDFANNTARLYSNAVLVASGTAPVDITTIDDVNNWLGRSQWPDSVFQGKFNEFRIWDGVLLPNEIAGHYAAGPDSLEPVASPELSAAAVDDNLVVTWSESFVLESSPTLGAGALWTPVTATPTTANGVNTVTVPIGDGNQFYRLAQP